MGRERGGERVCILFYNYQYINTMIIRKEIKVKGMKCPGCDAIIEDAIRKIDGVLSVKANFDKEVLEVSFDSEKTGLTVIKKVCSEKGYILDLPEESKLRRIVKGTISFIALGVIVSLLILAKKSGFNINLPEINSEMGYWMIFLIGLLTGIHCIGMCGSFILGYTARDAEQGHPAFRSHLLYGVGKIISYAMFGAIFGFLGSLFRITPVISGISIGIAGVFLILYGLKMIDFFVLLKTVHIRPPERLTKFTSKKYKQKKGPFYIGFFSGFILGCGPLQVMYVMAAGNGNLFEGALFLAIFALGTLPALLGFGLLTRLLTKTMTRHFIKASGIILIVLGVMMLNKGVERIKTNNEDKTIQPENCCHMYTDNEKKNR